MCLTTQENNKKGARTLQIEPRTRSTWWKLVFRGGLAIWPPLNHSCSTSYPPSLHSDHQQWPPTADKDLGWISAVYCFPFVEQERKGHGRWCRYPRQIDSDTDKNKEPFNVSLVKVCLGDGKRMETSRNCQTSPKWCFLFISSPTMWQCVD